MQYPGYIDVRSDLVRGDACSILLLTMWLEILCSLSLSIAVADERVLVIYHFSFVVGRRGRRTWFLIFCHSCVN